AAHWHMDETRWLVFVEVEGKAGNRWWLWVVVTQDTCVFILDPFTSNRVNVGYCPGLAGDLPHPPL
ncbi:MAG: transposase, partial [Candidatus Auribacterota bacterium]|nr:transposase [Candidatus Auribacterota bacterium]